MGTTLFDKLWQEHEVTTLSERQSLLYIDRIFLHERTGSVALNGLLEKQRSVRRREHAFCTMDHIVDTLPGRGDDTLMPSGRDFIVATRHAAHETGIQLFDIADADQGIVHVISPELGIALPGLSLICPDSHTCTLGGLGALAWGVGSTEAEHALATSTLRVTRPQTMRVSFAGLLNEGVSAKDLILFTIRELSASGGAGYAIEFAGPAIEALPVEARLTLCNMTTELSAFTGLIAPDQKVLDYCAGRRYAPQGEFGIRPPNTGSRCAAMRVPRLIRNTTSTLGRSNPSSAGAPVRNTVSTGMLQSPTPVMPPMRRRRQPGSARKTTWA